MATDTRVETHTLNDLLCVQALTLCVGVEFIEVRNAQSQIGVGEQFYCLGLGEAHEQRFYVLFDCPFLE